MLCAPLTDLKEIQHRHDTLQFLMENVDQAQELFSVLDSHCKEIGDVEAKLGGLGRLAVESRKEPFL